MEHLLTCPVVLRKEGSGLEDLRKISRNLWQEGRSSQPWNHGMPQAQDRTFCRLGSRGKTELTGLLFTLCSLRMLSPGPVFHQFRIKRFTVPFALSNLKRNHQALEHTVQEGRVD